MARRQPACWSFCAMAQAMLRLLAKPKITAVFCGSVTGSFQRGTAARCDSFAAFAANWDALKRTPTTFVARLQVRCDSVLYVQSLFIWRWQRIFQMRWKAFSISFTE